MIDTHVHVWRAADSAFHWMADPRLRRDMLIGRALAVLARDGVHKVVLVSAEQTRSDTESMLAVRETTSQVAAVIGWMAPGPSTRERLRSYRARGLAGIRLRSGRQLEEAMEGGLVQALEEEGLVLQLYSDLSAERQILEVARRYPRLRVLIDHLGMPRMDEEDTGWHEAIRRVAVPENVHLKLTFAVGAGEPAALPARRASVLDHALEVFGHHRTVYGGNWPVRETAPDALASPAHQHVLHALGALGDREARKILHDNPVRLFTLEDSCGTTG